MRLASAAVAAALLAPAADAAVLLGVHGDAERFRAQTGQPKLRTQLGTPP